MILSPSINAGEGGEVLFEYEDAALHTHMESVALLTSCTSSLNVAAGIHSLLGHESLVSTYRISRIRLKL